MVHNSPSVHPRITKAEKDYIHQSIGTILHKEVNKSLRIPDIDLHGAKFQ